MKSKADAIAQNTCKLCLKPKELCNKSHIYPKWLIKDILSIEKSKSLLTVDFKTKKRVVPNLQSGFYEGELLCHECENLIGTYEKYASNVFRGKDGKFEVYHNEPNLLNCILTNLDFQKFQLFIESIIWKSHISTNPFFDSVNLGPFAEIIRNQLLHKYPSYKKTFQASISYLDINEWVAPKILAPLRFKDNNGSTYYSIIHKWLLSFNISKTTSPIMTKDFHLKENGELQFAIITGNIADDLYETVGKQKNLYLKSKWPFRF